MNHDIKIVAALVPRSAARDGGVRVILVAKGDTPLEECPRRRTLGLRRDRGLEQSVSSSRCLRCTCRVCVHLLPLCGRSSSFIGRRRRELLDCVPR